MTAPQSAHLVRAPGRTVAALVRPAHPHISRAMARDVAALLGARQPQIEEIEELPAELIAVLAHREFFVVANLFARVLVFERTSAEQDRVVAALLTELVVRHRRFEPLVICVRPGVPVPLRDKAAA